MNWYSKISKTSQTGMPPAVEADEPFELSSGYERFRGNLIFEVRVPKSGDDVNDRTVAISAAEDLLQRVQSVVGDEVLFVDENSLTSLGTSRHA